MRLRPNDRHCLNAVEMNELYENFIHFTMENAMSAYLAKEQNKVLRREFGAQEIDKNLLQDECLRLKAQVTKIENAAKAILEGRAKTAKDQVADLQRNSMICSLKFKKVEPSRIGLRSWRWSFRTLWHGVVRYSSRAKTLSRRS